jgi:uncharacterized protein involved in exopolysaccharide biosynthesis
LADLLFARPNLRWVIEQEGLFARAVATFGMADATAQFRKQITFTGGDTDTIVIAVEEREPERAQRVARRLGQSLQNQVGRDSAERAESTRKFLEQEQAKLGKELRDKDEEYARFLAAHPEFAPERRPGQSGVGRVDSPGGDPADPSAALRRQAERLRRGLAQMNNPQPSTASAPPPPQPRFTQETRDAIAAGERDVQQARQELQLKETQFTGRHPDLIAARNRLSAAQDRLARTRAMAEAYVPPPESAALSPASVQPQTRQEMERQLRSLESAMTVPKSAASDTASGALAPGAAAIVSLETQWATLTRDVAAARDRYASVQQRYFRASMAASAETSGGRMQLVVAEDAYLPTHPAKRGPLRVGAISAFVVLVLGCGLMLGLGHLDQRVFSQRDLEHLQLGPVTLVVPRLHAKPKSRLDSADG